MTASTAQSVQYLNLAYFGRPADPASLTAFPASGMTDEQIVESFVATSEYKTNTITPNSSTTPGGGTTYNTTNLINTFYQRLFGRLAVSSEINGWSTALATGTVNYEYLGITIMRAGLNLPVGTEMRSVLVAKFDSAELFSSNLASNPASASAYSTDAAVTSGMSFLSGITTTTAATSAAADAAVASMVAGPVAATPAGQTFTLATTQDTVTGGAGDDSVVGLATTLTVGDTIDGGAGTDTVNVTIAPTAAATVQGFTLTNVENLSVGSSDGTAGTSHTTTFNLLNSSATGLTISGGGSDTADSDVVAFTNVAGGTTLTHSASNTDATLTYLAAATAGAADSVSLNYNGAVATAAGDSTVTIGAGFETLNINSSGTASTAGTVTFGGGTVNFTGAANLTLRNGFEAAVDTFDASAFTGNLTVTTGNVAANTAVSGVDVADITIIGGSGNDDFDISALDAADEISASMGAGNDTVTIGAALAAGTATLVADTLDGGAGTDILEATGALMNGMTTATTTGVSNFETLQVSNALAVAMTTANVQSGISTVNLAAGANAGTITFEAGASTVNIAASNAGLLTINDTGTATTDSVTINNTATAADDMFDGNALTTAGVETLNIVSSNFGATEAQDVAALTMTADTGGTTTVNFSGTNRVTAAAITANVIDASGLTAQGNGITFAQSAAAVGVTSIIGSEGADTLVGDAASTISGGGGNDTITGGAGIDTLNGGAGNDTITTGAGNDTVNGGAGDDTLVFAANLATGDTITGGDGTDTISITNASLTTIGGYGVTAANTFNNSISGVERVLITDALNQTTFDVGRLDNVSHLQINAITGAESLTGFTSGATLEQLTATGAALTLAVDGAATGTADALTMILGVSANTDYNATTIADVETLTIDVTETTASANIRVATAGLALSQQTGGAAQTVNIIGTETLTVDTAIDADTIDASGMTVAAVTDAGLTMSTSHTEAQTITGSGKVDVLYGSTVADTINAGAGNDTIHSSTGADVIDGGAGTDTFINTAMVGATIEGTGSGTSTGIVVNLGTTAVASTTINAATGQFTSGAHTSIGAGRIGYLFATESAVFASALDTISNVENVTLSGANGANYVVGSAVANTIVGGSGADDVLGGAGNDAITGAAGNDNLTGGAGQDTFTFAVGASTVASASSIGTGDAGAIAAADTLTFGNGVDVITDFTAGADGDIYNNTNGSAAVTAIGVAENNLTEDTVFFLFRCARLPQPEYSPSLPRCRCRHSCLRERDYE